MASITGTSVTFVARAPGSLQQDRTMTTLSSLKSVSFSIRGKTFPSVRLHPMRSCISCAAKPETVDKVAAIVKKQLALPDDTSVTGDSTFSALGADSLDTVEVVMALEEEFGISVEEESAQNIATVQDAADLIEKLVGKKDG